MSMQAFSSLLDQLIYTRSRNDKVSLIADYLRTTADPDRGWAMAALTGSLNFPAVKSNTIRKLIMDKVDPVLFTLSRDYVGDTAETVSLLWPTRSLNPQALSVSEAVDALSRMTRTSVGSELEALLDRLDESGRFALLKMATGGLRIGVSSRLAKLAFSDAFGVNVADVDEIWHVLKPPFSSLFTWAAFGGEKPNITALPTFRPFMLAVPLEGRDIELNDYAAEWKWDGIRVQLVHVSGETRLYSRGGDDITAAFPEIAQNFAFPGVMDGELLVRGAHQGGEEGGAASFNALQQRLGRKTTSKSLLENYPAFVRLYDILFEGEEDLRDLPWHVRRSRLEASIATLPPSHFDISSLLKADNMTELSAIRDGARDAAIEGIMLKRRDSHYVAGRRTGLWYKWKRDPLSADCVVMYAQRGSGKRSSFYSDFTFGCWSAPPDEGGEIVPVGKAYSGFTDEEMKWLDSFVRRNSIGRFGPVRELEKTLVVEVAFDSIHESKRHKSGVAMRFPRISRIRKDKPASEADLVKTLVNFIT